MQSITQTLEPTKITQPRRALWRRILLPRFSLRTLIILVTLFSFAAAWVGNWVYRSEKQRRAVAKINAMKDVFVAYDFDPYSDEPRHKRRELWAPNFFLRHLGPDYFYDAYRLHITSTDPQKCIDGLEAARDLPVLRHVNLFNTSYERPTPEVWEELSKLEKMEELVVCDNASALPIPYDQYLNKLPRFRSLWLCKRSKSTFDFTAITKLQNLEELTIAFAPTTVDLEKLSPLRRLKSLALFAETENALKSKEDSAQLQESAQRLRLIVTMFPELEELLITEVRDLSDLKILMGAKKLKKLYLFRPNLLDEEEPKKILPHVEIFFVTE